MARGKRELVFQINGKDIDYKVLKKGVEDHLKTLGISGGDNVVMYLKIEDRAVYCVVNDEKTIRVEL